MEQIKIGIEEKTNDPNEKIILTNENGTPTILDETEEKTVNIDGKII